MFWALVETETGERLYVTRDDKRTGGKAVLPFLSELDAYCAGKANYDTRTWFSHLDAFAGKAMCERCKALVHAYYAGDWDYAEDEYQLFLHQSPYMQLPEEDFQTAVKQVREKWTDIEDVILGVETLLFVLTNPAVEENFFFDLEYILPDLEALLHTLKLLRQRKAHKIRIKFI